jgi:hypothetical protein
MSLGRQHVADTAGVVGLPEARFDSAAAVGVGPIAWDGGSINCTTLRTDRKREVASKALALVVGH